MVLIEKMDCDINTHFDGLYPGVDYDDLDAAMAIELMASFYADVRLEDARDLDADGDMLLFEWGIYDNLYGADIFTYGNTRQAIRADDNGIWQFSLTLLFPTAGRTDIPVWGNHWCGHPAQLGELRAAVAHSPATLWVADRRPESVELTLDEV